MSKKYFTIIVGIILVVVVAGIYWWNRGDALLVQPPSIPNNINILPWKEAVVILHNGQVRNVMQTHALDITLILKNGKIIKTKEPGIDDILEEINKCGNSCKGIGIATE